MRTITAMAHFTPTHISQFLATHLRLAMELKLLFNFIFSGDLVRLEGVEWWSQFLAPTLGAKMHIDMDSDRARRFQGRYRGDLLSLSLV